MERVDIIGANKKSNIACYFWKATTKPIGIVYFAHGVTEHIGRHKKFLEYLSNHGYIVCANEHMGHGNSKNDHPMYFEGTARRTGWECACEDANNCIKKAKEKFGTNLPVHGIGFSLGSFIVRSLAIQYPKLFKTMILLGTGDQSGIELAIGKAIAKLECKKSGGYTITQTIEKLTFETYNKHFEKTTRADWLCADRESLEEYLNDTQCGTGFTAGLFLDLLNGMEYTGDKKNIAIMIKHMPILMISGECDAVGNFKKGVESLRKKYEKARMSNVQVKFFPGMRHDVLHETNAADVQMEILNFLTNN